MGSDEAIATVGDAFDLINGFAFKSADFVESGIPVIKIKNVKAGEFSEQGFSYVGEKFLDKRRDKLARIGDLLISMSGNRHDGSPHTWVGKVAYFNKPGRYFINQRVGALRPKQGVEVDLKFAAYVLASMNYQQHFIAVATSSGGQANLSPTQILGAPLSLPCYAEQREIGRLISALDDRINLLRQTNTTLEAIAQALFKSWFVDFDPVHAKAEGREPEAMDAATAALFPSEFEESELGPIPKGWSVKSFDDSVTILGGGTPKTSIPEYWDGDIPWFSVVDAPATGQVFTLNTTKKITRLGLDNCSAKLLPPMTTIISARGTVGKVTMTGSEMAMNQSCYGLRPKVVGGESFTYFSTLRFVEGFRQVAHGAVFDTITRSSFDQLFACRPPNNIISCFGAMTAPLLDRIRMNGHQAIALATLRDTLLPRLISGKLRLSEATETVEAALA